MPSASLWMTSSALWCSRICSSSSMKSSLVCSLRRSSAKSLRALSSSLMAASVAASQLAPPLDQELLVFRLEARLLLERFELVVGAAQAPWRRGSRPCRCRRPRRAACRRDPCSSSISLRAASALLRRSMVLALSSNFLPSSAKVFLSSAELSGEFVVRRARVGRGRLARPGRAPASRRRRDNEQQQQSREQSSEPFGAADGETGPVMARNLSTDALHPVHFLVTLVTEVWRRQSGGAGR